MKNITDIFKNTKVDFDKLEPYGFMKENDVFVFSKDVLQNQFMLKVVVKPDGLIFSELNDVETGDEYIIHLLPEASGAFVGKIRQEYQYLLDDIKAKCFVFYAFKQKQTNEIIKYLKDTYNDEVEFLWKKFPDNAVVRRKDNKKWYAALLTVKRNTLGINGCDKIEILNIRMAPEQVISLIDKQVYFPAYHMNKKNWLTIRLDDKITIDEIFEMIDESYILAKK